MVAVAETVESERQTAETVASQSIDAGLVKDNTRLECAHAGQDGHERREILFVPGAVGELDINAAPLLPERKVVARVERDSQYFGIVLEEESGTVALMDVEIDDRGTRH